MPLVRRVGVLDRPARRSTSSSGSATSDGREGEPFDLWFDPRNMHLFDPATGDNLAARAPAPA